jgi:plastocyanin
MGRHRHGLECWRRRADFKIIWRGHFPERPSGQVKRGAKVTWTNRDDIPYNVVSTAKTFSSPVLDTGQSFSFTFNDRGQYPYYCKIHPRMTGTISVA